MADEFGSDFMTIVDEDGTEYELEVLSSLEYNGSTYLEPLLCAIEDEAELDTVYQLIMDQLYAEDSEDEE